MARFYWTCTLCSDKICWRDCNCMWDVDWTNYTARTSVPLHVTLYFTATYFKRYLSLTERNRSTIKIANFKLILRFGSKIHQLHSTIIHLAGCVLTKRCASIVGCSCYTFQFNRSINSKRQCLDCATIAFSGRYNHLQKLTIKISEIIHTHIKLSIWFNMLCSRGLHEILKRPLYIFWKHDIIRLTFLTSIHKLGVVKIVV
jgi:hypothetical protein